MCEREGVQELEENKISCGEIKSTEENEGVGGQLEREEREEEDELVEIDERPERFHGRLSGVREAYKQS